MVIKRPKSLRELALEYLRESIIDGKFQMGQVLSERKISEELGVSKSPVREALALLHEEGLVQIKPQKGVQVFTLTEDEVFQLCDFRFAIETSSFELALKRDPKGLADDIQIVVDKMVAEKGLSNDSDYIKLDNEFHLIVFEHAANDYLTSSYLRYSGKIATLRKLLSQLPQHTDLSLKEHIAIAKAVRAADLDQIKLLLSQHITRTRETYSSASQLLSNTAN